MSASLKVPTSMSAAEFLAWQPNNGQAWQLVDGEPYAMAPANRTHGALQAELAAVLRNHLRDMDSPCSVVIEPGVVPHVRADHNVRIPDLAVTCSDYGTEQAVLADCVLVIEVLSISNRAETWANVWTYTTIPSVREIVVLHTVSVRADVLRRGADGTWPIDPDCLTEESELTLGSVGLSVRLADLYVTTRLRRPVG